MTDIRNAMAVRQPPGNARAWTMIALLTILTICSFVDRYVMTLLLGSMHQDLALTDIQFGILIGPAFIIPYAIVLFPVAWLVDRCNRQLLVAAGTVLWSAMTIASAWASSFEELALMRVGLALGEAVLAPAAISLVGDLFTIQRRRLPMVFIVLGSQVGVAAATLVAAVVLRLVAANRSVIPDWLPQADWRLVFVAVGMLPIIAGATLLAVGREPARGLSDAAESMDSIDRSNHVRSFWPLYLCAGLLTALVALVGLGVTIWAPTILMRQFDTSVVEAGYILGSCFLIANVGGVLAFPLVMYRLTRVMDATRAMLAITLGSLLAMPAAMLVACLTHDPTIAVGGLSLVLFAAAITYPLPSQIVQLHTPAALRGRVGATMLLILFTVASGLGPAIVPWMAALFSGNNPLSMVLVILTFAVTILGTPIWLYCDRWLRKSGYAHGSPEESLPERPILI